MEHDKINYDDKEGVKKNFENYQKKKKVNIKEILNVMGFEDFRKIPGIFSRLENQLAILGILFLIKFLILSYLSKNLRLKKI